MKCLSGLAAKAFGTSYRFSAKKNIVPYKRMVRQIDGNDKCALRG
jgi:hypothetical protein